ncbi:MAG TPA: glycosyltransferase family 4 protein [Coleofasciculaceae cyanobacterium]|jgi:glycosyltransferase involved in cell wall biosynthesis
MRVLFIISSVSPNDWNNKGLHGIHNRMEMFVDAIKEIAHLDVLWFVASETNITADNIAKINNFFCLRWNTEINFFFCHLFTPKQASSKWQTQSYGILNFFKHPGYIVTAGSFQVTSFEECLRREPDAIFAHRLLSMCPAMMTKKRLPPIFFDLDDLEPVSFIRKLRQPPSHPIKSLPYYLQVPALWWGTYKAIALSHKTFVCSEQDRNYLTKQFGLSQVVSAPNSVAIPKFKPLTNQPTLLLIGSYIYQPNVNAANFLIEKVWPHIYREIPEARLIIAGKEPSQINSFHNRSIPGLEFTGFVDDLDELYQRVRIVCCPIFSGAGTRVKMVEAAAYGKPIVASQLGAEGLKFQHNKEFILANDSISFAESCVKLLKNQTLCEELGVAARARAIRDYERVNIVRKIQQSIAPEFK